MREVRIGTLRSPQRRCYSRFDGPSHGTTCAFASRSNAGPPPVRSRGVLSPRDLRAGTPCRDGGRARGAGGHRPDAAGASDARAGRRAGRQGCVPRRGEGPGEGGGDGAGARRAEGGGRRGGGQGRPARSEAHSAKASQPPARGPCSRCMRARAWMFPLTLHWTAVAAADRRSGRGGVRPAHAVPCFSGCHRSWAPMRRPPTRPG